MSAFVTYAEVLAAVEGDLDLEDEVFITPADFLGWCNDAIREAEKIILDLAEDYFMDLNTTGIVLAAGTAEYAIPSGVFADKIRNMVFSLGGRIYEIKRKRRQSMFTDIAYQTVFPTQTEELSYLILNKAAGGRKIVFYPTPTAAHVGAQISLWHIRSVAPVAVGSDPIELPEFRTFIERYMKAEALEKEGHPDAATARAELDAERKLMQSALEERVPDNDTIVEADYSHYLEHT